MTVAYVNRFQAGETDSSSSLTVSTTTTTGTDCLVVFASHASTSNIDSSSCTFNGVSMTKLFAIDKPKNTGWMVGYYLLNPSIGTYDATINWASSVSYRSISVGLFSGVGRLSNASTQTIEDGTSVQLSLGTSTYAGIGVIGVSSYNTGVYTPSGWTLYANPSPSYLTTRDFYKSTSASEVVAPTFTFSSDESGALGGVILYPNTSSGWACLI